MNIVGISGSPSAQSRSSWLLGFALARLGPAGRGHQVIALRDLPAQALVTADASHPELRRAIDRVADADLVVLATPIYKAAYSGLLKLFLDLLPQDALCGKVVLPIATGGSLAHLLAIDYALKPVLFALGAGEILGGVFGTDKQLSALESGGFEPDDALADRLDRALRSIIAPPAAALRRASADALLVADARC